MPIRKALVPVDGSEVSLKAAALAAQFAAKHEWDILLFHVLEHVPMPDFAFPDGVKEKTLRDLREQSRQVLAQAKEVFDTAGVGAKTKLVEGLAAQAIIAEAERCDIVVLGSTGMGHGSLGSLLLGSVAEDVIRKVKAAILLVKEESTID